MTGRALFERLAVPRRLGTPGHAATRALLAAELAARGFRVDELPFRASAASLAVVAAAGYALAALGAGVAARVLPLPGRIAAALGVALAVLALLGAAEGEGRTLVGRRGTAAPRVWLVAHYDTKGQALSMALRIVVVGACVAGLLLAGVAWFAVSPAHPATLLLVAPAVVGGVLLGRNGLLTDATPGAVDNATGLMTVFLVLDALGRDGDVGVIFTDAEEFGMAGARELARRHGALLAGAAVVNFDGIDDGGATRVLAHRTGPVGDRLARALGVRPVRRLPVVVDGMALAGAAAECVTVLRGSWATARRVHTPADAAGRVTLDGAAAVARAVAQSVVDGAGGGV